MPINNALLNLNIGSTVNNDSPTNTAFTFLDIAGSNLAVGNFAGHAFGSTITAGGDSFALKNSIIADGDAHANDVGLVLQPSSNYFVSSTWAGDAGGTNVTDAVLTDGQAATFGTNAFATIQDAINAYHAGTTTAIIVNPGTYGDTVVNQNANIVLQASATSSTISIASLSDTSNVAASITIPAGTTLNVGGDNVSTIFAGVLGGSGRIRQVGNRNDRFSIRPASSQGLPRSRAASCNWATGPAAAPSARAPSTSIPWELSSSGRTSSHGFSTGVTLGNAISRQRRRDQVLGTATIGAIALAGTSTFTGSLTINGGQLVLGNAAAIGNPAQVSVSNSGQLSFGSVANLTFSSPLALSTTGFGGTGGILFSGPNDGWAGPITLTGTAELGAPLRPLRSFRASSPEPLRFSSAAAVPATKRLSPRRVRRPGPGAQPRSTTTPQ